MNIKKNDTVIVLSGKDKGVKGKVLTAMPKENKVIVEKVNVATCHTKPRRQGEAGGIVKRETPIRSCKVALFCEKCNKGVRVGYKMDGDKMYEFLDRLFSVALPRVRDFRGINPNSFDGRGNYAFGLKEQLIFPEIEYDKVDKIRGMDICICTTAATDEEAKELLTLLGAPFTA